MRAPRGISRTIGRRPILWRVRLAALVGAVGLVVPLAVLGGAVQASAATANTVTATVPAGSEPFAVAVNATTNTVYVTNNGGDTVSVISGATNTVTNTVILPAGSTPAGVAVNATTNTVYVTNRLDNTVSVIDGVDNTVTATVTLPGGSYPTGVAVNASTNTVYVTNRGNNTVSVIAPSVTKPGVPSGVLATAGNGQASVAFTPPASDGGSAITGYTVTATDTTTPGNGGQTASGTGSPIVVTGLTNGDRYTFTVTATNAVGTGAASAASSAVTPATAKPVVTPSAPALAATGSDQALSMGLAGLLLIAGLAVLGAARLRSRSGNQHLG